MRFFRWALNALSVSYFPKRLAGRWVWIPLHFVALCPFTVFSAESDYLMRLMSEMRPTDVVLDIGANQGSFYDARSRCCQTSLRF